MAVGDEVVSSGDLARLCIVYSEVHWQEALFQNGLEDAADERQSRRFGSGDVKEACPRRAGQQDFWTVIGL